ncbi:hypothetical protein H7J51_22110 [Mycobacterium crocinum]|uniref:Uncharacterized protein n=1 Tax=Mycolicibacterium crocinum TaxID=388459 RepID=A0ABY3TJS8_9MYCO|nr:hypothetical protein [Mycolicibacterium crocinum]MCV7217969.1 hypothetical protein [Mycolicibacterium crocinum]ULN39651.1 hypothetical protein MI149_18160 [Mycolicibacterium crocinum]
MPVNCLCPDLVGKTWEPGAFEKLLSDVGREIIGAYGEEGRAAQRT